MKQLYDLLQPLNTKPGFFLLLLLLRAIEWRPFFLKGNTKGLFCVEMVISQVAVGGLIMWR